MCIMNDGIALIFWMKHSLNGLHNGFCITHLLCDPMAETPGGRTLFQPTVGSYGIAALQGKFLSLTHVE